MLRLVKTLFILTMLLGCSKTIVLYDEDKKKFVTKKGQTTEGSITLQKGDKCEVVDDIFVVCGQ